MADHVPPRQLKLLTDRDGHLCAWTQADTERLVPQHRQGGSGGRRDKHQLPNLLWLDAIYNGHIESNATLQKLAKVWGIKISLHATPEKVPVFFQGLHRWFRLDGNRRIEISAVEALDMMHQTYGDEYFRWRAEVNG